jgi:tetratricopeptide (TPR) repeat protein
MSTGPKLPAPPVVGRPSDSTLTRVGGEPSPLLEEGGRPLELRTTAPDPAPPQIPAPTLLDLPDYLFPIEQSLDPDALALPPLRSPERWRQHADALLAEARAAHDAADNNGNSEAVRVAMSGEAGRIYLQQLGQRSTSEPLLAASSPAVRRSAEHSATITHLADELDGLAKQADDSERPISLRAATWIEHGQRAEQQAGDDAQALASYRKALELAPDHPVALDLAIESALRLGQRADAVPLVARHLEKLAHALPQLRAVRLLELAELAETPEHMGEQLRLAVAADPTNATALRRLIRALRLADPSPPELPALYRSLARLAPDAVTSATSLQLAVLSVGPGEIPRDVLEDIRAWLLAHGNDSAAHGLLDAVVRNFGQRDPRGSLELGIDGLRGVDVLVRLANFKDDPREQAILREQIARLRWDATPLASRQSALDDDGTLRRLAEDDNAANELPDSEREDYRVLEADLRFVRRYLPEQRWVWQALASVLRTVGDTPALIGHLTEWAQTRSHGPERATILLRLGFVHERLEHDLSRSAEVYELAVAEDPKNTACLRALGSVYEKMRRWAQAAAILQRQARETTDGPERLAALRRVAGIAEQELHDVDLAIVTLQEIAEIDQDDVLSLLQLAGLCRTHDRPNILIQTLQLLVERLDEDIARTAILVELGEAHETRLKQRTAAREAYERALKLSPGYTPALRALARLYRDNGDLEGLLRLHEPEVDATSDPAVLALKAGRICFEELGDMERAIEYLWRAYRQNPDLVPAREILLQLLSATGKIRDAYDLLRAQDPPHSPPLLADFHYRLGLIAEALARQDDDTRLFNEDRALQHHRAALAVQPDHGLAFERSRRLLVANHDLPNLIRLTEDQLQHVSGPIKAALLVQLGRLYLGTGDLDAARASYETAVEVAPDDGVILREYKTLLRRIGDTTILPALRLRLARSSEDTHYKATLLVESAEVLLQSEAPEDREFAAGAILGALKEDPGNPYAVRLLEGLLSDPNSPLAMTDAVGARAVRAQSDSERAIFYLESAELLEHAGAVNEAQRAYRAALRAMPGLTPADMGLSRLSSGAAREQATPKQKAVSVHTLMAEARDAAVRAGNTGTAEDAETALILLGQILGRDPHYRDAIGLTRALATQLPEPAPAINLLSTVFGRITDAGLRYELGVFLGEQSTTDDDAVAYFTVAAQARPDGKQALRGLVRCYQQLGREAESAHAMEQLLALYDPGEPSAVDLRLILAGILAQSPDTMSRALEHARIVLQARGDDPRAIQLMASLLERSQLPAEAADILERLAARERDPDRLHDLYMQRAKLLADVPGREAQALAAIEKAAELGPGNRTTILLLIRLLERSGQVDRVATYLDPIRAAMLASIGRGTVAPTDIRMLAEVAARPNPPLAQMARVLCYAIEPNSAPPPDGHMRAASGPGLQNVLATPALRQMLLAPAESADISDLLACVESAMDRMYVEFVGLGPDEIVPVPANVDVQGLAFPLRAWGRLLGIEELSLRASSINNTVALLDEGDDPTLRLGVNLWIRGDLIAWRGLAALALARRALGGGKVRSLVPVELDLMLAASFEVTKVFNAITADPDTRRLRDLTNNLGKNLPRRQRRPLLRICQALSSTHFEPAATARATLSTDLRMALLLSGDVSGCLAAACLLDGFANGSLKQRISLSRTAQDLAVFMLSDAYLALRRQIAS